MKNYKNTYELYQSVFDEVHASDELLRKVENMSHTKPIKKMKIAKRVALIAATVAVLFVASNVISYAATGATWVEHFIHATINGNDYNVKLEDAYDENGQILSQRIEVDYGNGIKEGVEYEGEYALDGNSDIAINIVGNQPAIVKEQDKIYLEWTSADIKKDITEDLADGEAKIYLIDDKQNKMLITVTGTDGDYKIVCSSGGNTIEYQSE